MKFIKIALTGCLIFVFQFAKADEGMWLPQLLQKLNESRMKSLGMKINAADIYSINKGSLKDAVVSFGGFCTGDVISSKGLVLTNHHCGFDAIQNHSSLQNNYIRDGFWAKNYRDELTNKGLFVTFIVRIDDVSSAVMQGVTANLTESERQSVIDKNINEAKNAAQKEATQESFVRGFFEGNQYYLFVTETYRDIRLVGAPPAAIGNFGKDTDNWVWPRHTGDFSMFRIYAGKNNKPADYSSENVPYAPKKAFNISLDGIAENDFTMVFGFPGRTTEYLYSEAVEQIRRVNDPAKIAIRDKALSIMDGYMRRDESIKIQYAAKYANVQNAYKKWQGEVLGLTRTDGVGKKKLQEAEFQRRVDADPKLRAIYGSLLSDLNRAYADLKPYGLAADYYTEVISKIEWFTVAGQMAAVDRAYKTNQKAYSEQLVRTKAFLSDFLPEYSAKVDRSLFTALLEMYAVNQPENFVSPVLTQQVKEFGSYANLADAVYGTENLNDTAKLFTMLDKYDPAVADAAVSPGKKLYRDLLATYQNTVQKPVTDIRNRINNLQRTYMRAQMEVFKEKTFYPDANSTLRLTFGKVQGYTGRDAVRYDYMTFMDGIIEKYVPGDYEFDVPEKLRTLFNNKDFGSYGMKGRMPVCFIATNHTTGGNSGSPALDAYGNLIGLNFDRAWEGTMSDINYDPSICRNIMVDIRYVLFIIDKFAGATNLVAEMKFVHPKRKDEQISK